MKHTVLVILGTSILSQGAVIISDDFSTSTIDYGFRLDEADIDGNWQAGSQGGGSAWTISGGSLSNSSSVIGATYPDYIPSEGPAAFLASVSNIPVSHTLIELTFDYSVAVGDTLNVMLVAHTGAFTGSTQWVGNIEPKSLFNPATGGVNGSDTVTFNQIFSTALAGGTSATFSTTIDLATAGIAGVSTVGDLTGLSVAFAKVEDGTAGATSISGLSASSIPEPTSGALLGLGALGLLARRRR